MTRNIRSRPTRSAVAIGDIWAIAGLLAVTLLAFWPMLENDFVNWDDPTVILQNSQLTAPHVVAWAFSTTLIGHYQPLTWLVWSALIQRIGPSAAAFHATSLLAHATNGVLVYLVARRLIAAAGSSARAARIAAAVAASAFALHPLRVEAVAWASAFPYVLSTTALLASFLVYIDRVRARHAVLKGALYVAIAAYAASLLIRPIAIAFPFVLLAADVSPLRRRVDRRVLLEKLPFLILALAALVIESRAREIAPVQDVGIGARLTMAVTAPFVYLGRTIWPVRLSPLDPLPIAPEVDWLRLGLGAAGFAAAAGVAWRMRDRYPALLAGSLAYVLLLAPVAGLTPTGQQATADRYMYLPGIVVALLAGAAVAHAVSRNGKVSADRWSRIAVSVAALTVLAALGAFTWKQTQWWHDSITLWTRAADLNPQNDIATYNLAVALADAGRDEEAIARYEQTLRTVPDQALARQHLNALQARRAELDGDRLADAGRLGEAEQAYARALALDARRLHARAARGIVLSRMGRTSEALTHLRSAYDANVEDAAVINALAFALTETGSFAEAVKVLKRGVDRHPDDVNLTHNLARLLATAPDATVRDGALAIRLAIAVRDRTGGNDPRVLDTLAAAYAAAGQLVSARETADRAAARAREIGDAELAAEIAQHARSYGKLMKD